MSKTKAPPEPVAEVPGIWGELHPPTHRATITWHDTGETAEAPCFPTHLGSLYRSLVPPPEGGEPEGAVVDVFAERVESNNGTVRFVGPKDKMVRLHTPNWVRKATITVEPW